MFTITGYESKQPCLICNARNGAFAVTSSRNDINGPLCTKCLTRIVKIRTATALQEPAIATGVAKNERAE